MKRHCLDMTQKSGLRFRRQPNLPESAGDTRRSTLLWRSARALESGVWRERQTPEIRQVVMQQ